ncbi:MAG: hypothetical protein ABSA65_19375 [Acidimicrobiales bacterium]|jgi:hypothetical protein
MAVVELTMRQGVEIEDVREALKVLIEGLRPGGCTTCGLLGVDIVIRAGDPVFYEQVSQVTAIKEVLSVSQGAATDE